MNGGVILKPHHPLRLAYTRPQGTMIIRPASGPANARVETRK
jgi:hypothetical protein